MSKSQHVMSPLLLEAILFLKVNSEYWGQSNIAEAMGMNKSSKVNDKITEIINEQYIILQSKKYKYFKKLPYNRST